MVFIITEYSSTCFIFFNHFITESSFEFFKMTWPTNSLIRASDSIKNTEPELIDSDANQGVFEQYLKKGVIPLTQVNPEEEHTYTITWQTKGGQSIISYYIDCREVMQSNTSLAYPRKIRLYGNYKQLKIDWIRTCGR